MKEKHSGVDTWAHVQSEDGIDWRREVSSFRGVAGNRAQGGDEKGWGWGPAGRAETKKNK